MSSHVQGTRPVIPVLLLKTKSTPGDSYEDKFLEESGPVTFQPVFVPVLQHAFLEDGLAEVGALLREKRIGPGPECAYGGLIFTSQRAVEAFAKLVDEMADTATWSPESFPVYSVGPATTRALSAVRTPNPLSVFGAHTGNGEALAQFILEHYPAWYAERRLLEAGRPLPPLLFLVGETRRDVIPKTLQDPKLPEDWRIGVSEVVVYGTREMPGFADELRSVLERTAGGTGVRARWAVVFSPTGCDGLLRELGLLDETTGKVVTAEDGAVVPTYIATIGPTTRDHLRNKFGFEAHVCASAPTPEALCKGIMEFMR